MSRQDVRNPNFGWESEQRGYGQGQGRGGAGQGGYGQYEQQGGQQGQQGFGGGEGRGQFQQGGQGDFAQRGYGQGGYAQGGFEQGSFGQQGNQRDWGQRDWGQGGYGQQGQQEQFSMPQRQQGMGTADYGPSGQQGAGGQAGYVQAAGQWGPSAQRDLGGRAEPGGRLSAYWNQPQQENRPFFSQQGPGQSNWGQAAQQGAAAGSRQQQQNWGAGGQQARGSFAGRGPKGYRRSDDRINEDVCERLTQHPDIDATEIEIRVSNGEVTLIGNVDSRLAKRLAEDVVEDISGVREIHNQMRVQPSFAHGEQESAADRGRQQQERARPQAAAKA